RTKPPPPCKYGPPAHPEGADQRLDRLGSDSPDQRSSHQDATPATALERVARRPLERASSPPGHPAQAIAVDARYAIPDLHGRRSVAADEFRRWQGHVRDCPWCCGRTQEATGSGESGGGWERRAAIRPTDRVRGAAGQLLRTGASSCWLVPPGIHWGRIASRPHRSRPCPNRPLHTPHPHCDADSPVWQANDRDVAERCSRVVRVIGTRMLCRGILLRARRPLFATFLSIPSRPTTRRRRTWTCSAGYQPVPGQNWRQARCPMCDPSATHERRQLPQLDQCRHGAPPPEEVRTVCRL